ncbi:MAG: hypothetical protein IK131_12340 [Paludibacteraceae bacterium]|nr:hypothetical protein [Paludibacteraceae bacterium]MBR5375443.1 hypothetical protein [Paludibacteraceae bacterium]
MGSFLLFILMVVCFLFFGVLGAAGKMLGGFLNMFRGSSSHIGGDSSSDSYAREENNRNGQTETGLRRMKRFKSWAEDTSFEEAPEEKVEMQEPLREEMMNK